jgi:hypothetical protein
MGVHPGAVNEARRLKPSIPAIGAYGIPICDEIDLERKRLTNYRFDGVARFRLFVP